MFNWLIYLVFSWGISWLLSWFFVRLVKRSNKKRFIKRLGGLSIGISFLLTLLVVWFVYEFELTIQLIGLIFGSCLILFFGLLDDWKNFSWKWQLLFQIALGLVLVFFGFKIDFVTDPFGGMIRTDFWEILIFYREWSVFGSFLIMAWLILVMNSVNWSDGMDGILGTLAVIGMLAIFFVSLLQEVNQPSIAILALIFLGSVLGFWWFNFPPGRIEAGTSGSYLVGFILASLSIIAGTKIATTLLVLSLVIIDAFRVIILRIKAGKSIFARDNFSTHLHYELRELGWSNRRIIFIYLFFLSFFLFTPFFLGARIWKLWFVFFEVIILVLFLWYIDTKKIKSKK